MLAALAALSVSPDFLLIDFVHLPAVTVPQKGLVKGDSHVLSIAAASIVAKVTRDRWMGELGQRYPAYGFHRHKGYGTAEHRAALESHGPCPEHRRTFRPVLGWQPVLFAAAEHGS
jgi:ribonuclease HII